MCVYVCLLARTFAAYTNYGGRKRERVNERVREIEREKGTLIGTSDGTVMPIN